MAIFKPTRLFKHITGRLSGDSKIMTRLKKYYYGGKLIKEGPNEAYVKERRNYKRHPLTAGERRQREKWTYACREASRITHDVTHPRYAELHERWLRVQGGKGDPVFGKRRFTQFGNFVRAVLLRE